MTTMTPHDLQLRLCRRFGASHAVLFGRARSAVTCLLDVLGMTHAPVLIPANVCPAVVNAVLAAGARPVLLPVTAQNGLVGDAVMAAAIHPGQRGLAMPCHLYGFRAGMGQTVAAARTAGWFLLENDSLATCAIAGRSAADATLISFGYAKTIEAGGGGAMVLDDGALAAELSRVAVPYPPLDEAAEARERWFMETRRHLRNGPPGRFALTRAAETLVEVELLDSRLGFPDRLAAPVATALAALDDVVAQRIAVREAWDRALAPFLPALAVDQPIPWRLIRVLEPQSRNRVVHALRQAGFDAGTNFPNVAAAYPTLLPAATEDPWGETVLNLWLSPDYTPDRIAAAAAIIAKELNAA
jgi:dTDP-4-amino-4,6-dideoxygalactose transaminase